MHVPSSMSNAVASFGNVVFFAALPANYGIIGSALSADTFENSDRLQLCPLGCMISSVVFNISIRDVITSGTIEYAIFKVERASETPTTNQVYLPNDTEIGSIGLQAAMRQYQPGRVIKYGQIAVAAEQPRVLSIKGNYGKFKMAKLRTGDYYGIIIFNRASDITTIDVQSRYLAKI